MVAEVHTDMCGAAGLSTMYYISYEHEVLILKGSKFLSVSRRFVEGSDYIKMFMKRYLR